MLEICASWDEECLMIEPPYLIHPQRRTRSDMIDLIPKIKVLRLWASVVVEIVYVNCDLDELV